MANNKFMVDKATYDTLTEAMANTTDGNIKLDGTNNTTVVSTTESAEIQQSITLSGKGIWKPSDGNVYVGAYNKSVAGHLTIAKDADITMRLGSQLNGRHNSASADENTKGTQASTLTVENGRLKVEATVTFNGLISVSGDPENAKQEGDLTLVTYGKKIGSKYEANLETKSLIVNDRFNNTDTAVAAAISGGYIEADANDTYGLILKDWAYVKNYEQYFQIGSDDHASKALVENSKLEVQKITFGGHSDVTADKEIGDTLEIKGRSVVISAGELGDANKGTVNISGESQMSIGSIAAEATNLAINITITADEMKAFNLAKLNVFEITSDQAIDLSKFNISIAGETIDFSKEASKNFTIDGIEYTAKLTANGSDGVANDIVITKNAISLAKADGTNLGNFNSLSGVTAAMTEDTAYVVTFNGSVDADDFESKSVFFTKDVTFAGTGTYRTHYGIYLGQNANDGGSDSNTHNIKVTVAKGSDLLFLFGDTGSGAGIPIRYGNGGSTSLTIEDASLRTPMQIPANGLIAITGSGTRQTDADGNVLYGFKRADGTYVANLSSGNDIQCRDRENCVQNNEAITVRDYGHINGNIKVYKTSTMIVDNSKVTTSANETSGSIDIQAADSKMLVSGESYLQLGTLKMSGAGLVDISGTTKGKIATAELLATGTIQLSGDADLTITTAKYTKTTEITLADQAVLSIGATTDGASGSAAFAITMKDSTALSFTDMGLSTSNIQVKKDVNGDGYTNGNDKFDFKILASGGTVDISGMETTLTAVNVASNINVNVTLTSADFAVIPDPQSTKALFEITGGAWQTGTVTYLDKDGKEQTLGNVALTTDTLNAVESSTATSTTTALDNVTITIDGNAYTIGDTIAIDGQDYKISWEALGDDGVKNDLVAKNMTVDPYMISSQNFVTDTTLSGTAKAYYRNPDESYSGFKSIYNVGSGATLTIAEGVAVDLERDASGTKSIILVGANNYFASQGFEATGAGDLVVNGTLDVGQLNAMADGTITVNGELNITTACIEKGALIYNSGSIGAINALNIFNDANATVTVNGLATLTLAGEPAHAFNEKGATDIASRFVVNVTDADLADMTGDTHTILDVKSSSVSIADKFTLNVNGAAYTMGEEFSDAAGNKYVINMGDAGGDSTANDLIVTLTEKAPEPVIPEDPVLPEDPGVDGGASTEPSQKVYINPYYNEHTLGYFSDVMGEELVLGKNAFTSVAAAKKALGANADIEYCTSDWNSSFSGKQLEGIAKISNNGYSMGYTYANYVQQYNMSNGALNLNKVTADTDFENFAYVNISGSKLSGAIENNAFGFFGTGNAEKASGTAWFAQGGMVNISGSTVGEVTGYAYATLNGSDVDVLSNNDVLYANVTLENGEITSCKPIYAMANGMAQINNSDVGLLENYSYVNMSGSNIADVRNVNMIGNWGGSSSIDNFVGASMYSSISNGYGCSLTLGDVTMNGSFDSIVNYGGTLVLTGNLKGVEMLYGYGDLVASDEQIKQLGGAEKVKQTYFGDIVDLGSTADGFSGKAAELADNSEAKAVIWDEATEGGLRGWLGIGSDVDVKDSVDYVKFTAASDGTLDITSSAWSSTGDKVSINGTDLAITDGAVSFGVTAGTEYLVKIERKDNNSMSYDMTLA